MVDIPPVFLCFYCSSFFSGALQLSFCFVFVFSFVFTPLCTQDPSCVSFSWTGRRGTLTFTTTACRISRRWALTISAWTAGWPATTKTRRMRAGLTQITKRTNHSTASGCRPLAVPLSQSCQRRLAHALTFNISKGFPWSWKTLEISGNMRMLPLAYMHTNSKTSMAIYHGRRHMDTCIPHSEGELHDIYTLKHACCDGIPHSCLDQHKVSCVSKERQQRSSQQGNTFLNWA